MKPAGHFVFSCLVGSLSHGHLIHLPVFFNLNLEEEKMKLRIIFGGGVEPNVMGM